MSPDAEELPGTASLQNLLRELDAETTPDGEEHPCSYLDGRIRASQFLTLPWIPGEHNHTFMERGFRRMGHLFYRMRCPDCSECIPIRIPVADFKPSRSQRRVRRRNQDVTVDVVPAQRPISDEAFALYERYLDYQHPDTEQPRDRESVERLFYEHATDSMEVSYRVHGRLMGVSLLDVCPRSWSSVYFFFEPDFARRSPGVFSVLVEIGVCRRMGVQHYYLGNWIAGCPAMAYKANYRPCEVLIGGVWRPLFDPL
jgi:arginine-tRNA-protein transferase